MNAICLAHRVGKSEVVRPSVLIVGDSTSTRTHAPLLESSGYDVRFAKDGPSALGALGHSVPDIVLLDFMMPKMSGSDFLRALRARPDLRFVPVILLAADERSESVEEGFAAGADDYLTTPVNHRILSSRLRSLIASRENHTRANDIGLIERERDHLRGELDRARDVQRAQLPSMPQAPQGWSVRGTLVPCGPVGGDLFDVIHVGARSFVTVVDVSGHGLGAAIVASSIRSMLRLLLPTMTIGEAATQINDHLLYLDGGHYSCMTLVELDGTRATVINAGLPPVLVIDTSDGRVIRTISGSGTPPGLFASGETYEATAFEVEPGQRLVVMSDGLTEPFEGSDLIERLGLLDLDRVNGPTLGARLRSLFLTDQPDDVTLVIIDPVKESSR